MTDRPIIFSAPMVRALLEGRKTQTRRILKPQLVYSSHAAWPDAPEPVPSLDEDGVHCAICGAGVRLSRTSQSGVQGIPIRFSVGDRLFVRENHRLTDCECTEACRGPGHVWYEADSSGYRNVAGNKLRPSIHMPRWASRLTLIVTGVKIERLQAVSEDDAKAEGCGLYVPGHGWISETELRCDPGYSNFLDPRLGFESIWTSINGADSWTANPFVIAVSFKVAKANIDAPEVLAA